MSHEFSREAPYAVPASGIGDALFPKVRRRVLALFLLNPDKRFYFREAVRLLRDTPATVQKELKSLAGVGILTRERIGVQVFYQANPQNPIYSELRSIAEKTFGVVDVFREVLTGKAEEKIEHAFIYGSVASGEDTGSSDIDLMVVGSIAYRDLVVLLKPVEERLRRPVNPTLYSSEELHKRARDESNFIKNVLNSKKLFIIGREDDFTRMAQ